MSVSAKKESNNEAPWKSNIPSACRLLRPLRTDWKPVTTRGRAKVGEGVRKANNKWWRVTTPQHLCMFEFGVWFSKHMGHQCSSMEGKLFGERLDKTAEVGHSFTFCKNLQNCQHLIHLARKFWKVKRPCLTVKVHLFPSKKGSASRTLKSVVLCDGGNPAKLAPLWLFVNSCLISSFFPLVLSFLFFAQRFCWGTIWPSRDLCPELFRVRETNKTFVCSHS